MPSNAPRWLRLPTGDTGAGLRLRPPDLRRRANAAGGWRMLAHCLLFGHRWRPSRSKVGYQTCERCRLRRLPRS